MSLHVWTVTVLPLQMLGRREVIYVLGIFACVKLCIKCCVFLYYRYSTKMYDKCKIEKEKSTSNTKGNIENNLIKEDQLQRRIASTKTSLRRGPASKKNSFNQNQLRRRPASTKTSFDQEIFGPKYLRPKFASKGKIFDAKSTRTGARDVNSVIHAILFCLSGDTEVYN